MNIVNTSSLIITFKMEATLSVIVTYNQNIKLLSNLNKMFPINFKYDNYLKD